MAFNFPRTPKAVPEYTYKSIARAADLYSDFLVYAASHAGGLQTQHLFNIQIVKNDLLHVLDCIFERPEKDDVFQQFRDELLAIFPTMEEEYQKLVKEVTKYESDNCYKKEPIDKYIFLGDSNTSMVLQRDSEQIDNQSIITQDAQSAVGSQPSFMAKDLSIILPATIQLPHHVIHISENDKLDLRSLGAGRLVLFNIKKHIRQLKAQGAEIQLPETLVSSNQTLDQIQLAQVFDKDDQTYDLEDDAVKTTNETTQNIQTNDQQSTQIIEQKEGMNQIIEPLVTESEALATEKTADTSNNQIILLMPKSLKLMLIKQKRFSNELKIDQVVHFLSMKSNYTRESVCQLNPEDITPQTFRNMKPTLLKGEDNPKPHFSALKPQQLAKLNEHIYIPKDYEILGEREANHAHKVQDFNKFLYFDLCTIEPNQPTSSGQQFSFLPVNQTSTYQGTGFLNNVSVCGLGTKQQQQTQNKQPTAIQGIIKYVHADCIQPFIDIYEDQFTYQFKIDQIVLFYDKTRAGFTLGRILMPATRQSRFHCHIQVLYVNKDILKQRIATMKKNKKQPIDILKQSIIQQEPSPENCLLMYTRFVLPVTIDQSLLEDCL